jgi:hypothetical protein
MTATTSEPMPAGWTDREVLQGIAAILWPSEDPDREWSSDEIGEVADLLATTRPELLPWSMSCLVDHSWAAGAYKCAWRRYTAEAGLANLIGRIDGEYASALALAELANAWEARP